jgi:hypothetical protein
MSKTAARFTLADVNRTIRAAKEQGVEAVDILPDGTIRVIISGTQHNDESKSEADKPEADKPKVRDFKL